MIVFYFFTYVSFCLQETFSSTLTKNYSRRRVDILHIGPQLQPLRVALDSEGLILRAALPSTGLAEKSRISMPQRVKANTMNRLLRTLMLPCCDMDKSFFIKAEKMHVSPGDNFPNIYTQQL